MGLGNWVCAFGSCEARISVFLVLAEGIENTFKFFFALRAKIKQKTTEFDFIFVDGMG